MSHNKGLRSKEGYLGHGETAMLTLLLTWMSLICAGVLWGGGALGAGGRERGRLVHGRLHVQRAPGNWVVKGTEAWHTRVAWQ